MCSWVIMWQCQNTGPIIVDVDGYPRWTGFVNLNPQGCYLLGNELFYDNGEGGGGSSGLFKVSLDGIKTSVADYASVGVTSFHHTFDLGKKGLLVEVRSW